MDTEITPERLIELKSKVRDMLPMEGVDFLVKETGFARTTCQLWVTYIHEDVINDMLFTYFKRQTGSTGPTKP